MPSASRRRKAAKKKKVKEANINPSSDGQQGSDDLKSQDEKGSDAGEVSLSANELSDFESVGFVKTKEDIVGKIGGELKSEETSDGKRDIIKYTESAEESNHENKNSNATSTYGSPSERDSDFKSCNSIQEAATPEYLGKSSGSAPVQMMFISENTPFKEIDDSVKTESLVSVEKSSDTESSLPEKPAAAKVGAADLGMQRNDDKVYPSSNENAGVLSLDVSKQKEYDSKLPNSSYGSPIPESTNAIEHTKDSEIPECSEEQPLVASDPPMRKSSWLNCCGLFELLGSNG
ncbi:uncharacterized protein LOC129299099 [Prosopis cineraria]|uniref:uncharacterized protein LOC129299099 n=1 Tax=Prosopis cineraria TaxID=364024 RepID=UPI00240FE27E|nr:uncharacterized protein LOC129299099 [Prosopis cineraria]